MIGITGLLFMPMLLTITSASNYIDENGNCPKGILTNLLYGDKFDCTVLYRCVSGIKRTLHCKNGLHFNPKSQMCESPEVSNCSNIKLSTCPPNNVPGFVLLPHEYSCESYYLCSNGNKILKTCGSGLHFNSCINKCDWLQNAKCVKSVQHDSQNNGCPVLGEDILPFESDATKFYHCLNGIKTESQCPDGLYFNKEEKICDKPKNVVRATECQGNVRIPHEHDCSKYYQCHNGKKILQSCRKGLHFSKLINNCSWILMAACESTNQSLTQSIKRDLINELHNLEKDLQNIDGIDNQTVMENLVDNVSSSTTGYETNPTYNDRNHPKFQVDYNPKVVATRGNKNNNYNENSEQMKQFNDLLEEKNRADQEMTNNQKDEPTPYIEAQNLYSKAGDNNKEIGKETENQNTEINQKSSYMNPAVITEILNEATKTKSLNNINVITDNKMMDVPVSDIEKQFPIKTSLNENTDELLHNMPKEKIDSLEKPNKQTNETLDNKLISVVSTNEKNVDSEINTEVADSTETKIPIENSNDQMLDLSNNDSTTNNLEDKEVKDKKDEALENVLTDEKTIADNQYQNDEAKTLNNDNNQAENVKEDDIQTNNSKDVSKTKSVDTSFESQDISTITIVNSDTPMASTENQHIDPRENENLNADIKVDDQNKSIETELPIDNSDNNTVNNLLISNTQRVAETQEIKHLNGKTETNEPTDEKTVAVDQYNIKSSVSEPFIENPGNEEIKHENDKISENVPTLENTDGDNHYQPNMINNQLLEGVSVVPNSNDENFNGNNQLENVTEENTETTGTSEDSSQTNSISGSFPNDELNNNASPNNANDMTINNESAETVSSNDIHKENSAYNGVNVESNIPPENNKKSENANPVVIVPEPTSIATTTNGSTESNNKSSKHTNSDTLVVSGDNNFNEATTQNIGTNNNSGSNTLHKANGILLAIGLGIKKFFGF